MFKRKVLSVAVAAALGANLLFPSRPVIAAPALVLHNDNTTGNFGDWYTGAVPLTASASKPVILFVQGLHSSYTTWTGTDSYYEAAYNAGYRTAFVQLKDSDGSGGDMHTNGKVLADVIRKVAAYYKVPKINIIAHSKGGIDTQTALVYYGASSYVNVVHQLSTPNKGSELADMAYSTWTSWLASIIGQKDDAVYSLQTSYMANYRNQTDSRVENNATKTYMSGGMGDDGWFTSYWFAHAVLPGEDDGAVSIYSALGLPYGITSFTKNISHSAMAKASQTWSLVQPKLAVGYTTTASKAMGIEQASQTNTSESLTESGNDFSTSLNTKVEEDGDLILRGGQINGTESVNIPLESGISSIALEVMTSKSSTDITLVSPSGKVYNSKPADEDSDPYGIFSKAVRRVFQINKPEAGDWKLELQGDGDAYFAMTRIETSEKTTVKADKKVFRKGESSKLSVDLGKGFKGSIKQGSISKTVKGNKTNEVKQSLKGNSFKGNLDLSLTAPSEPGVYNLSFDVEGVNDKGEKVVRSINYNFAVTDEVGEIQ